MDENDPPWTFGFRNAAAVLVGASQNARVLIEGVEESQTARLGARVVDGSYATLTAPLQAGTAPIRATPHTPPPGAGGR